MGDIELELVIEEATDGADDDNANDGDEQGEEDEDDPENTLRRRILRIIGGSKRYGPFVHGLSD
jgi:hypothetical protein